MYSWKKTLNDPRSCSTSMYTFGRKASVLVGFSISDSAAAFTREYTDAQFEPIWERIKKKKTKRKENSPPSAKEKRTMIRIRNDRCTYGKGVACGMLCSSLKLKWLRLDNKHETRKKMKYKKEERRMCGRKNKKRR